MGRPPRHIGFVAGPGKVTKNNFKTCTPRGASREKSSGEVKCLNVCAIIEREADRLMDGDVNLCFDESLSCL